MKLKIHPNIVAAMAVLAAKTDVRYYLNGIHFEFATERTLMVATTGTVLGVFKLGAAEGFTVQDTALYNSVIIPIDLFDAIKPSKKEYPVVNIDIGEQAGASNVRSVSVEYDGTIKMGFTIDGIYPDFRRVIPSKVSGEVANLDINLLSLFVKSVNFLNFPKKQCSIGVGHNGTNAALISYSNDDFCGIIMPYRGIDAPKTRPIWLD